MSKNLAKPIEIQVNREYCIFNGRQPFLSISPMRNGLFLTLLIIVLATSCQFFQKNSELDNFITLKPGYFCQLGAIAITGDTIFTAGSYLADDDPNGDIQLIYAYHAAIDTNGKLIWEQFMDDPDYTRWLAIANNNGLLSIYGKISSPLTTYVAEFAKAASNNGKLSSSHRENDSLPQTLLDYQLNTKAQFAVLLARALEGPSSSCISKRIDDQQSGFIFLPKYCVEGVISCARILNDSMYIVLWGPNGTTEVVNVIHDNDSVLNLAVPRLLYKYMVNDVIETTPNAYQMITTSKNEQGPCVYTLSADDSFSQVTCLAYWPMHGSTKALKYGDCTVLAFNASDSINVTSANVVLLNSNNEEEWEYNYTGKANFLISDLKLANDKIYLAGTYEQEGEGSSMAIKILTVPGNIGCQAAN
jgi:hypothetical protein